MKNKVIMLLLTILLISGLSACTSTSSSQDYSDTTSDNVASDLVSDNNPSSNSKSAEGSKAHESGETNNCLQCGTTVSPDEIYCNDCLSNTKVK